MAKTPSDRDSILNSKMLKSSPNKPLNSMVYALTESRNLLAEDRRGNPIDTDFNNNNEENESDDQDEEYEESENQEAIWERKTFGRLSILNKRGSTAFDARRLGG
jgi:hypothetical protein